MACETKTVSVLVHAGSVGGTSCEWCRDHISGKFVTEDSAGEPYRLPAHEKCHCAWQVTKITGITRNLAEKVRAVLEETTEEADNSDLVQIDKIQIMDECLDIAEQATEDAEESAAHSIAYYAEAADWLEQSEAALALAESYEVIQAEQQAIMNEALAIADQATDNADAAYAASLISYGLAADYLALSEAAYALGEADAAVQAEQQDIMNEALATADQATDNADAAYAASLISYGLAADYLALSEAAYALGEDDEAAQAEQQAIMNDALARAESATEDAEAANAASMVSYGLAADFLALSEAAYALGEADAAVQAAQALIMDARLGAAEEANANAEEATIASEGSYAHAADYLALSEAAYALGEDDEAAQAEQQAIMNDAIARAESATEDAEAANAASLVSYGLAADYLALSEAGFAQAEDYEALQEEQQIIMDECIAIAESAIEDADAANAASLISYATAANYLGLSEAEFALGEDCDATRLAQQAIMNECLDIAEEALAEADAANAASIISYARAAEYLAYSEAEYAQGEDCDAIQAEQLAIMNECVDIAEEATAEADAAIEQYDYWHGLAEEWYALGEEWFALGEDAEAIEDWETADYCYNEAETCFNESSACSDEADYYEGLAEEAIAIANGALDEYDEANAIYTANDPAPHYALAASYIQTCNDYLDEGDGYVALGLEATAIANDALDEYYAALAVFNANDPAPHYALAASYLQTSNNYLAEGDWYVALGFDATAIANEAMDEYDAALIIFNSYDPDALYAQAAADLQTSNDYLDEGDGFVALGLAATAIANGALDEYDAAEAIYLAHDPAPHYAQAAADLQTSNDYQDEGDEYAETALAQTAIANQAMDEYDAAEVIYQAHDPAPHYAQAAADLQTSNGYLDEGDGYVAAGLAATAIANQAMDEYDAALAVFNAHDPAPNFAQAAADLQTSNDYLSEGDGYVASALALLAIAAEAMDNYDTAEAIYLAHDPAPHYAQAAADLQTSNDYQAEGDEYVETAIAQIAIAAEAMDNYDAAEAIYLAHDPSDLYTQGDTYLHSSESCTVLAVYWAAQSVIFWGTAADALEDYGDAQFVQQGEEDRISILTEPITRYTNCQDNLIIEDELAKL